MAIAGDLPKGEIPLILDLLEWLAMKPRAYSEVMDAWRTSCPRLTVWEDANSSGFITQTRIPGQESMVDVSPRGRGFLKSKRPNACVDTQS